MSGKEAEVYLVSSGGEHRVAKVYKNAQNRTFKNRAEYTEGRNVRNSRDQRAMQKRTAYGRGQDEAAWRSTEVDMIYRLRNAGVRVPTPHNFIDGVLIMEMVASADGLPAPRLGEVSLTRDEAIRIFDLLIVEVMRMLCAGVVHGDLSEFNVLLGASGPVVIDFPQAVEASSNQNAHKLLIRDVDNLQRFVARFAPERQILPYAQEMWELYRRNQLTPETRLGGRFKRPDVKTNTEAVLSLIGDANRDEEKRRQALGVSMPKPATNPQRWVEAIVPQRSAGPQRQGPRPAQQGPRGDQPRGYPQQRGGGPVESSRGPAPTQGHVPQRAPSTPNASQSDRTPYPTLRNVPGAAAQLRAAALHAASPKANPSRPVHGHGPSGPSHQTRPAAGVAAAGSSHQARPVHSPGPSAPSHQARPPHGPGPSAPSHQARPVAPGAPSSDGQSAASAPGGSRRRRRRKRGAGGPPQGPTGS